MKEGSVITHIEKYYDNPISEVKVTSDEMVTGLLQN
jgi:hypothetical protein